MDIRHGILRSLCFQYHSKDQPRLGLEFAGNSEFMLHATRFIMRVVQGFSRDAWFYFSWNVNLENYFSWLVTWRFCVNREEPELLTDIRDFTTQFYVILGRKFSELLE